MKKGFAITYLRLGLIKSLVGVFDTKGIIMISDNSDLNIIIMSKAIFDWFILLDSIDPLYWILFITFMSQI